MDVNPRQQDPQFQSPLESDSERTAQFGAGDQNDVSMPSTNAQPRVANPAGMLGAGSIAPNTDVYGTDGKKVGTVQEVYEDSFMVQKGIFFVHDYFIPYQYVARATNDRIDLSITSDQAKNQDWAERPGISMVGRGEQVDPTTQPDSADWPDYGVYGPKGPSDTIQSATERGADMEPGVGRDRATTMGAQYGGMGTPASAERDQSWTHSPGSSGTPGTTPADAAPEYGHMGQAGPAGSPGIPSTGQTGSTGGQGNQSASFTAGDRTTMGTPGTQPSPAPGMTGQQPDMAPDVRSGPAETATGFQGTPGPRDPNYPDAGQADYGTTRGSMTPMTEQTPASGAYGRAGEADTLQRAGNRDLQGTQGSGQDQLSGPPQPEHPDRWDPNAQGVNNP